MNALEKVRARLAEIAAEIRNIDQGVEARSALTLNTDEQGKYTALTAERDQLEAREAQLVDDEARRAKLAAAQIHGNGDQARFVVTGAPQVYGRHSRNSYFLDLARYQLRHQDAPAAVERLNRHAAELDVELPRREAARRARAERGLQSLDEEYAREYRRDPAAQSFFRRNGVSGPGARQDSNGEAELRVNPNRTDGQGGYFVQNAAQAA